MGGAFDIVAAISKLKLLNYVGPDDFIDKLSFMVSCILLIGCSVIVALREYVMDPITCYMSHSVGGENLLKYVEHFCWVQGTMAITSDKLPATEKDWKIFEDSRLVYYQWVPFMLLFQCALFHLPRILWNIYCSGVIGIDISSYLEAVINEKPRDKDLDKVLGMLKELQGKVENADVCCKQSDFLLKVRKIITEMETDRDREKEYFTRMLKESLYDTEDKYQKDDMWKGIISDVNSIKKELEKDDSVVKTIETMYLQHREYRQGKVQDFKHKIYKKFPCCVWSKRYANCIALGYLMTKCFYLVNAFGQLTLMQKFLQLDNDRYGYWFGLELSRNIMRGHNWEQSGVFPRVAYCTVKLNQMGGKNLVTSQCVLTANLFIEKIYIFLWFWILIVGICTIGSFLIWINRLFMKRSIYEEIRKYLFLKRKEEIKTDELRHFCNNFLRLDGLFLINMFKINAGDIKTGAVINGLFSLHQQKYQNLDLSVYNGIEAFKLGSKCVNNDKESFVRKCVNNDEESFCS